MSIQGWYYQHESGDLISKKDLPGTAEDIRASDFAVALWPVDPADRAGSWTILVEASAGGADPARVAEMADKWGAHDEAAAELYAASVGCDLKKVSANLWQANRGDFVDSGTSPVGYGKTFLEAMAALCRALGYIPSKAAGRKTFESLLKTDMSVPAPPAANPERLPIGIRERLVEAAAILADLVRCVDGAIAYIDAEARRLGAESQVICNGDRVTEASPGVWLVHQDVLVHEQTAV